MTWKARRPDEPGAPGGAEPTKVRVFSVVDEPGVDTERPESMDERGLELRLGPWTVSVRLAGLGPQGRS
jgi:hypothetical protein